MSNVRVCDRCGRSVDRKGLDIEITPYKFHRFLVNVEREYSHEMFDLCAACKCEFEAFINGADVVRKDETSTPEIKDGSSYFLTPEDGEVKLVDCPVGLFEYDGTLGLKTEYESKDCKGEYRVDAFIVSTGERFCIDNDAFVKPCGVWVAGDSNE